MKSLKTVPKLILLPLLALKLGAADRSAIGEKPWSVPRGVIVATAPEANNLEYIGLPSILVMPDKSATS